LDGPSSTEKVYVGLELSLYETGRSSDCIG
jgi:hypothetical protein